MAAQKWMLGGDVGGCRDLLSGVLAGIQSGDRVANRWIGLAIGEAAP
jgi:hypothetical protein